ncbi:MAG: ribosome silencing factor [Desulfobacterales bacterium]
MNDGNNANLEAAVAPYLRAASGRKAQHLVALDVRELTSIADVFIICSGSSSRQVSAIGEYVVQDLKAQKIRLLAIEGKKEGNWVLLDYGHVIIHVFYEPTRELFDLESLWIDARRLKTDHLVDEADPI